MNWRDCLFWNFQRTFNIKCWTRWVSMWILQILWNVLIAISYQQNPACFILSTRFRSGCFSFFRCQRWFVVILRLYGGERDLMIISIELKYNIVCLGNSNLQVSSQNYIYFLIAVQHGSFFVNSWILSSPMNGVLGGSPWWIFSSILLSLGFSGSEVSAEKSKCMDILLLCFITEWNIFLVRTYGCILFGQELLLLYKWCPLCFYYLHSEYRRS